MTQPIRIMLPTIFDQIFEYAHACRQFPKVSNPASGTTAHMIAKMTTMRSGIGKNIRKL